MQFLAQADGDDEDQVLRIQMTDALDALSIVTTPKPVGIPIYYNGTEIALSMCGPGAAYHDLDVCAPYTSTLPKPHDCGEPFFTTYHTRAFARPTTLN